MKFIKVNENFVGVSSTQAVLQCASYFLFIRQAQILNIDTMKQFKKRHALLANDLIG